MTNTENKYWPFYVLPEPQRTELHQQQIDYLVAAYNDGLRPYVTKKYDFGASSDTRSGEIVWRGGQDRRWQLFLIDGNNCVLTAYIDGFQHAAQALMQWLHGDEIDTVLDTVQAHLYSDQCPSILHPLNATTPITEPLPQSSLPR